METTGNLQKCFENYSEFERKFSRIKTSRITNRESLFEIINEHWELQMDVFFFEKYKMNLFFAVFILLAVSVSTEDKVLFYILITTVCYNNYDAILGDEEKLLQINPSR